MYGCREGNVLQSKRAGRTSVGGTAGDIHMHTMLKQVGAWRVTLPPRSDLSER